MILIWCCSTLTYAHSGFFILFTVLGEQQDAVDNLITAMDLTDAQQ